MRDLMPPGQRPAVIARVSAARIEEQLIVTADGCQVITRLPAEDLIVAGKSYFTVGGPLSLERDPESHKNTELNHETKEAIPKAALA